MGEHSTEQFSTPSCRTNLVSGGSGRSCSYTRGRNLPVVVGCSVLEQPMTSREHEIDCSTPRMNGRPRGISGDELKESASSPTVRFKLVRRNRMMDRIFGETQTKVHDDMEDIGTMVQGWALLFMCVMVFSFMAYWLVTTLVFAGSDEDSGSIKFDKFAEFSVAEYYCLQSVLTIPVFVIFVYWNWVSMKIFVHN